MSGIGGVARPGIVHRIEGLYGLLLVAKSDVAHEGLSKQFAATASAGLCRDRHRGTTMLTGTVDVRSPARNRPQKVAVFKAVRGKRAVTHGTA